MPTTLLAVVIDCHDPHAQAQWWAAALDREVHERNTDEYAVNDPSTGGTPLYFMKVPEPKTLKNRVHVDIGTDGPLQDEVARLVAAGATLVDLRQDPSTLANPDTWAVMHDPEGNEFCVLDTGSVTGLA